MMQRRVLVMNIEAARLLPPLSTTPRLAVIVEPDQDIWHTYKRFLIPRRYIVHQAVNGQQALAIAKSDPPDVIVTELHLNGVDGFTLCELIRRQPTLSKVPIIVVTSDTRPHSIDLARSAGADVVLAKPCALADLFECMEQVISASRAHSDPTRGMCGGCARLAG